MSRTRCTNRPRRARHSYFISVTRPRCSLRILLQLNRSGDFLPNERHVCTASQAGRSRRRFVAPDCGAPVLPLFGKGQTFLNVRGAGRSPVVSPHLCLRVQKPCYTGLRCCKGRFAAPEPSDAQRPRSAPPAARLWRVLQTKLHTKILSACIVAGGRPERRRHGEKEISGGTSH